MTRTVSRYFGPPPLGLNTYSDADQRRKTAQRFGGSGSLQEECNLLALRPVSTPPERYQADVSGRQGSVEKAKLHALLSLPQIRTKRACDVEKLAARIEQQLPQRRLCGAKCDTIEP